MISADARNPAEFWSMSSEEFNKWRAEHDFPRILQFLRDNLKEFKTWQREFQIDDDELLAVRIVGFLVPTNFFLVPTPSDMRYFTVSRDKQNQEHKFVSINPSEIGSEYGIPPDHQLKVVTCKSYLPYLVWANRHKISIHPSAPDGKINRGLIQGVDSPENCRVYFLSQLEVLKLGGVKNVNSGKLVDLDLEFVNLDFLTFNDVSLDIGSPKRIAFSSARNWCVSHSDLSFFFFLHTDMDGLCVRHSVLHDWKFIYCEAFDCKISDTIMAGCEFGPGRFVPYFDNVDLRDSEVTQDYETSKAFGYRPSPELMRRMKTSFVEHGQHHKAGEYFYREKCLERKQSVREAIRSLSHVVRRSRKSNRLAVRKRLRWLSLYLKHTVSYFVSWIQWIWWGYGEKPSRVLFLSLMVILGSAILISKFHSFPPNSPWWEPLYFSAVSFLTVGDSAFQPLGVTRLVVATEALVGLLNLGLLIAGFTNKARY
jgi:hypothetical protein